MNFIPELIPVRLSVEAFGAPRCRRLAAAQIAGSFATATIFG